MEEKRNVLCDRIRSAKSWLNRAEDSFGKENDVQGELNLLLAQAELKHLQEKDGSRLQKNKHLIALFTAAFIAVSFWGLWKGYFSQTAKEQPVMQITEQSPNTKSVVVVPVNNVNKAASVAQEQKPFQINQVEKANTNDAMPESTQAVFSENEMREFVRTAGQVLRGNTQ